jgi:hypothetical protein
MKDIHTSLHCFNAYPVRLSLIRLVLHQSVKVQNTRTAAGSEYFAVYYFIHGK